MFQFSEGDLIDDYVTIHRVLCVGLPRYCRSRDLQCPRCKLSQEQGPDFPQADLTEGTF